MKVKISPDEWYPVITPASREAKYPTEIEVHWLFWILYVGVYKLFYWMWQRLAEANDIY